MALDMVERPAWLDNEFIQHILHSREEYSDIIVVNSEVQLAVGKGENNLSTIYRVVAEFKRLNSNVETENTGLIIKDLTSVGSLVKFLKASRAFEKEYTLYWITIPAMMSLLQQISQEREVENMTPLCYKVSRPETMILEDLMTLGFKMANRRDRLDLFHCRLALKGLAKFHAASVALYYKDPNSMDVFAESTYTESTRENVGNYSSSCINALANVVETWSGFEKYGEKLRGIIPTVWDRIMEIVKPVPGSLSVLTHGDFWINNMMFHYCPETGKPDQIRLIDFQLSRFSSPVLDLQYFIHSSPNEQVRCEYTEHLLEVYHNELGDTLKILGCDQHDYTIEQMKKEYEDKLLFGLHTGCNVLPAVLAEPDEAIDFENFSEDGNDENSTPLEKSFLGKRYKEVFQKLLPYFEKKGLL